MPTYCIICGKEKQGLPVANDGVLEAMRWFKRNVTKNEQGNGLVVCKEDYPTYKKSYDRYRSRQLIYLALGGLFFIITLVLDISPSSLAYKIISPLIGLGGLVFMYLLSLLNYTPTLELQKAQDTSKKAKHNQ